jgi:hypothetical protein
VSRGVVTSEQDEHHVPELHDRRISPVGRKIAVRKRPLSKKMTVVKVQSVGKYQ